MATQTPALQLVKPNINGPETDGEWGYDLNANFDKIDSYTGPLPSRIALLETSKVGEAPSDGQLYSRKGLGRVWVRNPTTTVSTALPSGGVDGDIWYQVPP